MLNCPIIIIPESFTRDGLRSIIISLLRVFPSSRWKRIHDTSRETWRIYGVSRDHGVVEFKGSFLAEIHFFELFRRGCPDDESRTRYVNIPTPSVSRVRWKLRAEIMKCYGNQGYPLCADTWNRKIDHGEWRALRCINVSYVLFEHRWKWNVVTDRIFPVRLFDFFFFFARA